MRQFASAAVKVRSGARRVIPIARAECRLPVQQTDLGQDARRQDAPNSAIGPASIELVKPTLLNIDARAAGRAAHRKADDQAPRDRAVTIRT